MFNVLVLSFVLTEAISRFTGKLTSFSKPYQLLLGLMGSKTGLMERKRLSLSRCIGKRQAWALPVRVKALPVRVKSGSSSYWEYFDFFLH